MSILSSPSILDKPDPASTADHEALASLCPAANLEPADWFGAILEDLDRPALTHYEHKAIAQYQRTGDLLGSAEAWLGDDDENDEHAPRAEAWLRRLLVQEG